MKRSRRSRGTVGAADNRRKREPGSAAAYDTGRDPACRDGSGRDGVGAPPIYAALDLGTNNCRLLIARPATGGFQVVDAFSRIIRLGEGLSASGCLAEPAIERTIDALKVCAMKMVRNNVTRSKLVATEACRAARNGAEFIERVRRDIGMDLEILSPKNEARLAVAGCVSLIDNGCDYALVFDIGGGSSELIWLDIGKRRTCLDTPCANPDPAEFIVAWTSLPVGVVSLAERFGGRDVGSAEFESMVAWVMDLIRPFEDQHKFRERINCERVHFLGTSGTVTTVAGIQLRLPRYDRRRVDGCWLECADVRSVTSKLLEQSYEQRVAEPCIGRDRADLVLAGCAILEALMRIWPTERLRVADRGLREGMLTEMMVADGFRLTARSR